MKYNTLEDLTFEVLDTNIPYAIPAIPDNHLSLLRDNYGRVWFLGTQISLALEYGSPTDSLIRKSDNGISSFLSYRESGSFPHTEKEVHFLDFRLKKQKKHLLEILEREISNKLISFFQRARLLLVSTKGLEVWLNRRISYSSEEESKLASDILEKVENANIQETHLELTPVNSALSFDDSGGKFGLYSYCGRLGFPESDYRKLISQILNFYKKKYDNPFLKSKYEKFEITESDRVCSTSTVILNNTCKRSPTGDEVDLRVLPVQYSFQENISSKNTKFFKLESVKFLFKNHFKIIYQTAAGEVFNVVDPQSVRDYLDNLSEKEFAGWRNYLDKLPTSFEENEEGSIDQIKQISPLPKKKAKTFDQSSEKVEKFEALSTKMGFFFGQGHSFEVIAEEFQTTPEKCQAILDKIRAFILGWNLGRGDYFENAASKALGLSPEKAKKLILMTDIDPNIFGVNSLWVSASLAGEDSFKIECFCGMTKEFPLSEPLSEISCSHGKVGTAIKAMSAQGMSPEDISEVLTLPVEKVRMFLGGKKKRIKSKSPLRKLSGVDPEKLKEKLNENPLKKKKIKATSSLHLHERY